ncbi:MAG: hypothetical protein JO354_07085 [Verrucomicrobia bacterium]|nr:hypothetical protein [Verrucomicrobiota bacterium]
MLIIKLKRARRVLLLSAVTMFFGALRLAYANTATYTFEQFSDGQSTPFSNVSPDHGPASFKATFTSSPHSQAFTVGNFEANQLFSGNSLFEAAGVTGNTLTVTLSTAVDEVRLDFATNSFDGSNLLYLFSPSGNTSARSTMQDGFDGGVLTFTAATPFSTFSLNDGPNGPEFAIDNLSLRIAGHSVPDGGATLTLLSIATAALAAYGRSSRLRLRNCGSAR